MRGILIGGIERGIKLFLSDIGYLWNGEIVGNGREDEDGAQ
jgi:hypothetical protein